MKVLKSDRSTGVLFTGFVLLLTAAICISMFNCGGTTKQAVVMTPERQKAINDSLRQVELDEKNREMITNWSMAYTDYQNKEYRKALPELWAATKLDFELNGEKLKYPSIFTYLAGSYRALLDETKDQIYADSVIAAWEYAANAVPDNISIRENLKYSYHHYKNDKVKAVEQLYIILGLETDPEKRIAHFNDLKGIYLGNQNYEKVIEMIDSLIVYQPDNSQLKADRLALIRSNKSPEEYLADLESMHKQQPDNVEYMNDLLREYKRMTETNKVIEICDKIIAKQPGDMEIYTTKKNAYLDLEKYDDAISTLNAMLKIKPNTAEYQADIAECYRLNKKYVTARTWVRRALRSDKNYRRSNYILGRIYEDCASEAMEERGGFGKISFDDKLVFEMAANEYKKARNDMFVGTTAGNRYKFLNENYIPKKSDRFMHPDQKVPKDSKYQWILK